MKKIFSLVVLLLAIAEPAFAESVADKFGDTAGIVGLVLVLVAGGYLIYKKREEKGQTHLHEKVIEEAAELFAEAKELNNKAWAENKSELDETDKRWKDTDEVISEAMKKLFE